MAADAGEEEVAPSSQFTRQEAAGHDGLGEGEIGLGQPLEQGSSGRVGALPSLLEV